MSDSTLTPSAPRSAPPAIFFTVLTAICVVLALFGRDWGLGLERYPLLVSASTGFLLVALLAGASRDAYGRFNLAALGFCWLGDVLGPYNFALGAGMFLLAHLVFVAAFVARGLNWRRCLRSTLLIVPSGAILYWLLPQVEASMWGLVIAYTIVITVMLIAAGGTTRLIFTAAVVFYVSDIFVARWRFVDQDGSNAYICYPLYYTACLLFALSNLTQRAKTGA